MCNRQSQEHMLHVKLPAEGYCIAQLGHHGDQLYHDAELPQLWTASIMMLLTTPARALLPAGWLYQFVSLLLAHPLHRLDFDLRTGSLRSHAPDHFHFLHDLTTRDPEAAVFSRNAGLEAQVDALCNRSKLTRVLRPAGSCHLRSL